MTEDTTGAEFTKLVSAIELGAKQAGDKCLKSHETRIAKHAGPPIHVSHLILDGKEYMLALVPTDLNG